MSVNQPLHTPPNKPLPPLPNPADARTEAEKVKRAKVKPNDQTGTVFSSVRASAAQEPKSSKVALAAELTNEDDWEDSIDPQGRFDEYDFGKYGKETCQRIETINQNGRMQLKKIAYLEKQLKFAVAGLSIDKPTIKKLLNSDTETILKELNKMDLPPAEKAKIEKIENNLRFSKDMLRNAKIHQKTAERPTFLATGQTRERMMEHGFSETHFTPSVPTNLRVQRFEAPESNPEANLEFVKVGVNYDPRDPGNSIPMIERFLKKLPDTKDLDKLIKQREQKADKYYKKKDFGQAQGIRASIEPLRMIKKGKTEEVSKYLENKKLYLNDQMASYVLTQVDLKQDKLEQAKDGAEFTLVHLSLLNEEKDDTHESGMLHNEAVLMEEMSANFDRFNGKKVIFDGKGPLIDLNGNIHSPRKIPHGNRYKELILKPKVINFTVQGFTKNGPIQKEINQNKVQELIDTVSSTNAQNENDQAMLENIRDSLNKTQSKLMKGKSNYEMACNFFSDLIKFKKIADKQPEDSLFGISIGCYSSKDRTGVVSDISLSVTGLKDSIDNLESDPKKQKSVLQGFARKILRRRLATKTVKDNTKKRIMKVSTFFLPLITDDLRGKADRTVFGGEQVLDIINDLFKKKFG